MATVYLANDVRHDRQVAIKVLHPELAEVIGADRFLQEIRVTAQLQHPHILPLFDSGEADGLLYYVMPYIEGESLRDRLTRTDALPVDEAVTIMQDMADALGEAHRRGIVHRDIKPENVMLTGRHAVVMDFGVAKAVAESQRPQTHRDDPGPALTSAGMAIGTPAYMAPEQVAADPDVDGRADLYALGLVAYEMVTGKTPFTGDTPYRVLAAQLTEPPRPITELKPHLPRGLAKTIMRCLAKDVANRWQSAEELLAHLRDEKQLVGRRPPTVLQVAGLLAVLLAAAFGLSRLVPSSVGGGDPSTASIAVLPFANLSNNPDNEYLGDGITEEILNALAQLPGLRVAARTSAFQFKGQNLDLREVGKLLGVQHLLEGSVQRSQARVRITAQLIDASSGFHLWSGRFDRGMEDLFAVEDEIARLIADTLQVSLGLAPDVPMVGGGTTDPEANELYLRGRHLIRERGPGLVRAVDLLQQALVLDPNFAAGYGALAEAQALLPHYNLAPWPDALDQAERSARRALSLDSSLVRAHTAMGNILRDRWVLDSAAIEYERALVLSPNDAETLQQFAQYLGMAGDLPRTLTLLTRARALDPLSPVVLASSGRALTYLKRHREAITMLEETVRLSPDFLLGHYFLMWAYVAAEEYSESERVMGQVARLAGADSVTSLALVRGVAEVGARSRARAILDSLPADGAWSFAPDARVRWYTLMGDTDRALDEFEGLIGGGYGFLDILADPMIDPLRAIPRFGEIMAAAGLPVTTQATAR